MNDTDPDDDPTPPRDTTPAPMNEPPPDSPVRQVLWLLERGRERGFRIGPLVEIAGVRVQVEDLRQAKIEGFANTFGEGLPPDFEQLTKPD